VVFQAGPRPFPFLEGLPPDILPRPRMPELPPQPLPPPPVEKPKVPEKDKEKKDAEKPKKDDAKPPPPKAKAKIDRDLPGRPGPEADPRDEYARLMRAGSELFADQQYGRAANRFRQASAVDEAQPLPYFLLAQALLEQGSYHDAYDAVLVGLRRKPDWPAAKFRPQELYGANLDGYADLLLALERTQTRHPNDPVLLLLRGYALWFDGRKEQAAVLFRRARKGPDGPAAERFLAALPDDPPL
jgi:tetratricopeptide (TPR) repeat protein